MAHLIIILMLVPSFVVNMMVLITWYYERKVMKIMEQAMEQGREKLARSISTPGGEE